MNTKNSIIYEPDFIILNPELLTSLCLYYDQIILHGHKTLEEELSQILYERKPNYETKASFIKNTLDTLLQENIVSYYDSNSIGMLDSPLKDQDMGIDGIEYKEDRIVLKLNPHRAHITIIEGDSPTDKPPMTSHQLARAINTEILSDALGIPKLMIDYPLVENPDMISWSNSVSNKLALQSLCTLALPRLYSTNVEDIVYLRSALKDELTEFKSGILQLTYLIYKSTNIQDEQDVLNEIDMLINTNLKAALLDMENSIKSRNKNLSSKLIVRGTKFLLHGILAKKGFSSINNLVDKGSDLLEILPQSSIHNSPDEKIASYLLGEPVKKFL